MRTDSLCGRAAKFAAIVWVSFASFGASPGFTPSVAFAQGSPPPDAANDRNWVALNIFDSLYPMPADQTFPNVLASLEVIYQLYTGRETGRDLMRDLGGLKDGDQQGDRSREGHFMIWIHFSDHFLANHPLNRQAMGEQIFMYPDRDTDIFTGWSGNVNLTAFLMTGVQGLAVGTPGNFQSFSDAVQLGDADYSGGWYMTDEQAAKIAGVFNSYPGLTAGYSFMSTTASRPNAPYDPPGAQLGNGYNCGDFAFYAITTAGVISRDEAESLKQQLWYPEYYFDHAIPLAGAGASIGSWLTDHPGETTVPSDEMIDAGWFELLFGPTGLEFFDKKALASDIVANKRALLPARIWDQTHPIAWLKTREDFRSKGIWTELRPLVESDTPITSPERTVPDNPWTDYRLTHDNRNLQKRGAMFEKRKLKNAHIWGKAGKVFDAIYETLKVHL